MFARTKTIYLATRKRHDQLFNTYFMRPIAAAWVAALGPSRITPNQLTLASVFLFLSAVAVMIGFPGYGGGLAAVAIIELSYCLDCADGMLARHRKIASKQGHLFDFFTDELKAVALAGGLGVSLWRSGGVGIDGALWGPGSDAFLVAAVVAVIVIAGATSLTNFVRRPEISGREVPVDAHYESVTESPGPTGLPHLLAGGITTFLRFLNHYPSHIWLFAAIGRLDLFFWIYGIINLLYLGRGWLGLIIRFGRFEPENEGT